MTSSRFLTLALACAVLGACHHATIETGATPSNVQINKPWASSWLWGLVPPATVSTAAQCPTGVASVETQQSFLNGLVAALTVGIYTPWSILATCAGGGATTSMEPEPADASDAGTEP